MSLIDLSENRRLASYQESNEVMQESIIKNAESSY